MAEQLVSSIFTRPKKGEAEDDHQPKVPEPPNSVQALQDGVPVEGERFHGQDRPIGRILKPVHSSEFEEVPQVPMTRDPDGVSCVTI